MISVASMGEGRGRQANRNEQTGKSKFEIHDGSPS
jgi:hypothetical protein